MTSQVKAGNFYTRRQAISSENTNAKNGAEQGLKFRRTYILLPLIILAVSVVITGWFYRLLPEEVGYRFLSDGSAESFTSRSAIVLWSLIPQVVLTLLAAGAVAGIISLITRAGQPEDTTINPHTILLIIGNMVGLPQIVLCFAMMDIFSYNAYQVHWLPLWVLIIIIMGGGALILGIYFLRTLPRVWKSKKE